MSDITRSEAIKQLRLLKADITNGLSFVSKTRDKNLSLDSLDMAIKSLETDEAYQLEYEKPKFCKADNSVLEDINKMLAEINGEIACAEYHEVECNHKTEKQDGRRVIAKIVHKYCDKYMESK